MNRFARPTVVLLLAVFAAACATTYGTRTVQPARQSYSIALAQSWNEQMLLNLVRLRYRDTPQFLDVSSVLTQYSFGGELGAGASSSFDGGLDSGSLLGGMSYSETPTVSYVPLEGENFAKRFLTPLSPTTILLLSQTGWSVERLMLCCVQRINDLWNAPSAAGPTPDYVPPFEPFQELAHTLRSLQKQGLIEATEWLDEERQKIVIRIPETSDEAPEEVARLRKLLGLPAGTTHFRLAASAFERKPDELAMVGRSLAGILFFLSQGVEPPPEHEEMGLVTVTRYADGRVFDWQELVGPLIRIRSSAEKPAMAFVKVFYRGHWFYIDDTDLNSKTTFGLVRFLFSLQAAPRAESPLLTVSAGG